MKASFPEIICVWVLKLKTSFLGLKWHPLEENEAPMRYEKVGFEEDLGVDSDGVVRVNLRTE